MKGKWLPLFSALLCPALAGASSWSGQDEVDMRWWVGGGLGGGTLQPTDSAPHADRSGFAINIDGGIRITPQWGVGLEFGGLIATSGCNGRSCTPAMPDFAPDFTRLFLLGEYRVADSGLRLRAGAGLSNMCYRFYKTRLSVWERLANVFLNGDTTNNPTDGWSCKSLHALGFGASIGYQWPLGRTPMSLGVQLRGEFARFAASTAAATSGFSHRALTLQLQLQLN